jgi:archaetidylinositol phosphate synthase
MIDSYLRKFYQPFFVDPLLPLAAKGKCSHHLFTFGALASGLAIVPALIYQLPWVAIIFLLASGYLDTLDGSVARIKGLQSPLGAVLDIVSDRVVETAIIIALYLVDPGNRGLYCLLMLGSSFLCVTSFLVVGIFIENESKKSFHYSPGIVERTEAFIFFGAMILFPSLFSGLAILFSALVLLTTVTRILEFRRTQNKIFK